MGLHIALIEWDSSETPSVYIGTTLRQVSEASARDLVSAGECVDDDEFFTRPENQLDLSTLDTIELDDLMAWHDRFHEATTVPWATFLTEDSPEVIVVGVL